MLKSKLIHILKILSQNEWNALEKFVKSPFHNQHKEVQELFQYLKSTNLEDGKALEEGIVFINIFKSKPFDKVKLRYVRSYLLKVTEQFLAFQEWQEDDFEVQLTLTKAYRKREISKQFKSKINQLQKTQNQQLYRNAEYFQQQYQLELETYTWTESKTRRSEMNLQRLSDTLDIAFIIEKLKRSCTLLTHQAVYKKEYQTGLLAILLDYIPKNNLLEVPAISIYYYSYLALKFPNEVAYFNVLKSLIEKHFRLFPASEFRNIYLLAINFCIRQINMGNTPFVKELFDLYRKGLDNQALLENGQLSRWTYKNIVAIGLGLQEYEWIDEFIHHYQSFLPVQYQENSFHYNLAELYYHRKQYQDAMQLLFIITDKDLLLLLSAKTLLCKTYYELEEWKVLDSFLHSFELFVRRQKAIGYHKQNYLNFAKAMKKLLLLNFFEEKEINAFKHFITEFKRLPEKKWLLHQLGK